MSTVMTSLREAKSWQRCSVSLVFFAGPRCQRTRSRRWHSRIVRNRSSCVTNSAEVGGCFPRLCPREPSEHTDEAQQRGREVRWALKQGIQGQVDADDNTMMKNKEEAMFTLKKAHHPTEAPEFNELVHDDALSVGDRGHWDDVKGGWLDAKLVQKGRAE